MKSSKTGSRGNCWPDLELQHHGTEKIVSQMLTLCCEERQSFSSVRLSQSAMSNGKDSGWFWRVFSVVPRFYTTNARRSLCPLEVGRLPQLATWFRLIQVVDQQNRWKREVDHLSIFPLEPRMTHRDLISRPRNGWLPALEFIKVHPQSPIAAV
jgi:hypothetical protein